VRALLLVAIGVLGVAAALWWPRSEGAFSLPEGFIPGQRLPGAYPVARPGPWVSGWEFDAGYRQGEILQWNYRIHGQPLTVLESPDRVTLPPPSIQRNGRRYALFCLGCDANALLARFVQ
jgi:hypothetical protein